MSKPASIQVTFQTADVRRGGGEVSTVFAGIRADAKRTGDDVTKSLNVSTAGLVRGLRDVEGVLKRIQTLANNGKLQEALKAGETANKASLAAAREAQKQHEKLGQEQIKRAQKVADAEAREAARLAREKEKSARAAATSEAKSADAAARDQTRIRMEAMRAASRIEQEQVKATAAAERQKVQLTAQAEQERQRAQARRATNNPSTQANLNTVGRGLVATGTVLTGAITLPVAGAVKEAIEFESAFAGVRKTIDATESELATLRQGFRDLSKELPTSAVELAAIGEAAGQLGVHNEDILTFTRTMANLGETTDLSSGQAADSLARFANIFDNKLGPQYDRLGATVVDLGNKSAATESEIVAMGLRISGAGKQIGLTEAQTLSFAAALASVGIKAEAGGSGISQVMMDIAGAVAKGGPMLTKFAAIAGMSAAQFKQAFQTDAASAITTFLEGLGKAQAQGKNTFGILDALGEDGLRVRDALLRMAGAGDLFRQTLDTGNKAWAENNALTNEAAQRYATNEARILILRNRFLDLALTIGDHLLKALSPIIPAISGILTKLENFGAAHPGLVKLASIFALVAAAIGPLLVVLGGVVIFAGQVVGAVSTLAVMFGGAEVAAGGFTAALSVIAAPLLEIVAVGALVIAAAVALYEAWAHNFGGLRDLTNEVMSAIQSGIAAALQFIQELWARYGSGIMAVARAVWQGIVAVVTTAVSAVVSFVRENFQIIIEWVRENWPLIKQIIGAVLDSIVAQVQLVLTAVRAFWEQHGAQIMAIVSAAWSIIKTVIQTALRNVLDVVRLVMQLLTGDWAGAWNTLIRISERMAQAMYAVLRGLATIIWNVLKFIVSSIWQTATEWYQAGVGLARSLVQGLVTMITGSATVGRVAGAVLSLVLGAGAVAQASAANQGAAAGHAFASNMRAAMAQGTAPGHGASGAPTSPAVQIATSHGREFPHSKAQQQTTAGNNPFAGMDFNKQGRGGGGGGGANKATRAADQAANAAMKQAEIDLQAAERIARVASATAQREYDARQSSLEQFTRQQIDTEKTLAAAKLAALTVERTEAEKLSKGTERTTKLKEIAEKAAQINADLAQRTAELQARQQQAELDAQRAHAQALLDLEEEYDRRDLARLTDRADRGLITAEQEAQQRAAIETAAFTRRLTALDEDLKAAGENAEAHARIVDEINKVTASKATAEEQAARRSAEARRKDLADAQKFAEQLRSLQDENDKLAVEIGDRRLDREARLGADPRYIKAQRAARDQEAENRYHDQQARELAAARAAVERSQQTAEQKAALRRIYDEREQLEAVRHADAIQEILDRPLEAYRHKLEEIAQSITGVFDKALDQLFEHGFKGFFTSVVQGFKDMLKQMLKDFILSGIQRVLGNLINIATGAGQTTPSAGRGGGLAGVLRSIGSIFFPGLGGRQAQGGITGGTTTAGDGVFTVPGSSAFGAGGGTLGLGALALNLLSGGTLFGGSSGGATGTLTGALNSRVNTFSLLRSLISPSSGGSIFGGGGGAGGAAQLGRFGQLGLLAPLLGLGLGVGVGRGSRVGSVLGGAGGLVGGALGGALIASLATNAGLFSSIFGGGTLSQFSFGLLGGPIGLGIAGAAAAALLIGGALLGRNAQRRRDEKSRDALAGDLRTQLYALISGVSNDSIQGADALTKYGELRAQYVQQVTALKDRKARDHAMLWLTNDLEKQVLPQLQAAIAAQGERTQTIARRKPEFADGGLVPGALGSRQHIVAHGGEVIANLDQQANLGRMLLALAGVPNLGGSANVPRISAPTNTAGSAGGGGDIIVSELRVSIDAKGIFVEGGRTSDGRRLIIESVREYDREGS